MKLFEKRLKKNLRLKHQDKSYQLQKKEDVMKRYHKKPEQKAKVKQRRKDIEKLKHVDTDYVLDNFIKKKLLRVRVLHVLRAIDFFFKIKCRNVILKH